MGSGTGIADAAAAEVAAMQFAGGMSIAQIAQHWDRDAAWVESAIRVALLKTIPQRDGGWKAPRAAVRAASAEKMEALREVQQKLEW